VARNYIEHSTLSSRKLNAENRQVRPQRIELLVVKLGLPVCTGAGMQKTR
jgi:hypothetical protein